MKIYYDFLVKDNAFSIMESRTRISGSAYSTLKKIESILSQMNTLTYKGSETDVVRKLKNAALVIVNQYHAKASKVHWLVRWLCCCFFTKKAYRIHAMYQRIKASAAGALEHPKDVVRHTLGFLSLSDIANFSAVNKQTHAIADSLRRKIEQPFGELVNVVKGMTREERNEALHKAAKQKDGQMLQCLLVFNANPDAYEDHNSDRALHWAAYQGSVENVVLLLKHRAVMDKSGYHSATPFTQAYCGRKAQYVAVMRLFLEKGADPNSKIWPMGTLMNQAIADKKIEIVKMLLEFKADPNCANDHGECPLQYAAALAGVAFITTLLDAGATGINRPTKLGYTPLFCAYLASEDAVRKNGMQLLLEKRADPNCRDKDGESLIDHMAYRGEKELLELMIAHGAQVNAMGNGMTPLGWACGGFTRQRGHVPKVEIVQLLLAKKADPHLPMKDGRLAVQVAESHRLHDLADVLLKKLFK
jgi:ankyrin repeat protein